MIHATRREKNINSLNTSNLNPKVLLLVSALPIDRTTDRQRDNFGESNGKCYQKLKYSNEAHTRE